MSEYQGRSKTIDFGSIYNNKPACSYLDTHNRIILFDSILNFEEAKELVSFLNEILETEFSKGNKEIS